MFTTTNISGSSLGRKITVRISRNCFSTLREHLTHNKSIEQFGYLLFSLVSAYQETILQVRHTILPSKDDLQEQSGGLISPTKTFQKTAYLIAREAGMCILDVHTHTHSGVPHFSGTDQTYGRRDALYVREKFPPPITHGMIVFNEDGTAHDGVLFDRSLNAHRKIDTIEILGRGTEIRCTGEMPDVSIHEDPQLCRQLMIPGWNQVAINRSKILVVGMGGNGAHIFQTLVSMGAGTEGWIAGIDPDRIEASNLPRIPYAMPVHVGCHKVTVAAQYAGQKNPSVRFIPVPCSVTEKLSIDLIKAATCIIGAGDNDGVRAVCNELAIRYNIPYIDLGCEIQAQKDGMTAGGQVRTVIPGVNGCLACCGGFDPEAAAAELMTDSEKLVRAAQGYVRGSSEQATPSVANLNGTIAQLGIAAFLALIHGERFGQWDHLYFDQLTGKTLTAQSQPRSTCPVCGDNGFLCAGDAPEDKKIIEPAWVSVPA